MDHYLTVNLFLVYSFLLSCNNSIENQESRINEIKDERYFSSSIAKKYLDESDESVLFKSFVDHLQEAIPPVRLERSFCDSPNLCDSLTFFKSNNGEVLTGRVISLKGFFQNELDVLKKFFPLDLKARYFPLITWGDTNIRDAKLSFTEYQNAFDIEDDTILFIIVNNKISFHNDKFFVLAISEFKSIGGSDYLISFNNKGNVIDCIVYLPEGNCLEDEGGIINSNNQFCFKTATCNNILNDSEEETKTIASIAKYYMKLNKQGMFELKENVLTNEIIKNKF